MIAENLRKRHPIHDLPIVTIRKLDLQSARAMLDDYLNEVIPATILRERIESGDFEETPEVEEVIERVLLLESASEPQHEPDDEIEPEPQAEPEAAPASEPEPPATPQQEMTEDDAWEYLENRFGGLPEDWANEWRGKGYANEPLTRLALDSYFGGQYKAPAVVEAERSEAAKLAREELLSQFAPDVAQAICEAKPARKADVPNNWVYAMCRYLKGTSLWNQPKSDHRSAVEVWWSLLDPRSKTGKLTHLEDCWMLYCKASEKTQSVGSKGTLSAARERATARLERNDLGDVASKYTNPAVQKLVVLCEELQRVTSEYEDIPRPFYLSCRDAAKFIGVSVSRTSDYLAVLLPIDGVLKLGRRGDRIEKGQKRTFKEKASEYYSISVLKQIFGDDVEF